MWTTGFRCARSGRGRGTARERAELGKTWPATAGCPRGAADPSGSGERVRGGASCGSPCGGHRQSLWRTAREEHEGMFERFTDRARRVVVLAQEEARMLNHNYIGTEHILLGLIH